MGEGPPNNNRTTVQLTILCSWGGGGGGQRKTYQSKREKERERASIAENVDRFECENFPTEQRRTQRQGHNRQECQVEFQQEAPPEPLPFSHTPPPPLCTHTHRASHAPRLECEVLPLPPAQPREPCPQLLTQSPASPANLCPLFFPIQQTSCITVTLLHLLLVHAFIPPSAYIAESPSWLPTGPSDFHTTPTP